MASETMLEEVVKIEKFSKGHRFRRFCVSPAKTLCAFIFNRFLYRYLKIPLTIRAKTFFGDKMYVSIPSGTDIYLFGARSHESEMRLTKFFIKNFRNKKVFFDVGAHIGFYALLASRLMGDMGKTFAFEASPETFHFLKMNTQGKKNIFTLNNAISDKEEELTFYEFNLYYCESNTLNPDIFQKQDWSKSATRKEVKIDAISLDYFSQDNAVLPDIIKIDVEGAELSVIKGAIQMIEKNHPLIIMEYLNDKCVESTQYREAMDLILSLGYKLYLIDDGGDLISSLNPCLISDRTGEASDNLVFIYEK